MCHGFNDWNVVSEHSYRISQAIKGKVPLIQYFHQGGHGGDPPMELMNKWFTRFLYDVQNGVENGPKAYIVRESTPSAGRRAGPPTPYADFPDPDSKMVSLFPSDGGRTAGGLSTSAARNQGSEELVDDVSFNAPSLAMAGDSPNRLVYETPELTAPVRISGVARVTVRLALSAPAANLSVYLVQLPWTPGPISNANLITRGWADPQNYRSLTRGGDYHSMTPGVPLTPGQFVDVTFDLEPKDQIIPAGKRIGLMILSSDRDFTLWPKPGVKLTVDLDRTHVQLPVVGGQEAFERAVQAVK
jgi:X-Pro dipeptidyl-peptidase